MIDARVCRRQRVYRVDEFDFTLHQPHWWGPGSDAHVTEEMLDYVSARRELSFEPDVIIDCGAAVGAFSILAARWFPSADIIALEPDLRQRILLGKNLAANGVANRVRIIPKGVHAASGRLRFRTHGDMSGIRGAADALSGLAFSRQVEVDTLDAIVSAYVPDAASVVVKMDIEGAEIEAVAGAVEICRRTPPLEFWIQAYHERDGRAASGRVVSALEPLALHVKVDDRHFVKARNGADSR